MELILNDNEIRVIGALIEKEMTTPEQYPLTINALKAACNQKSNRNPVTNFTEEDIKDILKSLEEKRLCVNVYGSRATRYMHMMDKVYNFGTWEKAIICELLIRGAQTLGELKNRTARMFPDSTLAFNSIQEVEETIEELLNHEKGPFVIKLERLPGQKENRYNHLFTENPYPADDFEKTPDSEPQVDQELIEKIEHLEQRIDELTNMITSLKEQLDILVGE